MNADGYYDPSYGVHSWYADMECGDCREETEHEFIRKWGSVSAWCTVCDIESPVEIDDGDY